MSCPSTFCFFVTNIGFLCFHAAFPSSALPSTKFFSCIHVFRSHFDILLFITITLATVLFTLGSSLSEFVLLEFLQESIAVFINSTFFKSPALYLPLYRPLYVALSRFHWTKSCQVHCTTSAKVLFSFRSPDISVTTICFFPSGENFIDVICVKTRRSGSMQRHSPTYRASNPCHRWKAATDVSELVRDDHIRQSLARERPSEESG